MGRYRSGARHGMGGRPRGEPTKVVRVPVRIAEFTRQLAPGRLRARDATAVLDVSGASRDAVPLYDATGECGFLSPAADYSDLPPDFHHLMRTETRRYGKKRG